MAGDHYLQASETSRTRSRIAWRRCSTSGALETVSGAARMQGDFAAVKWIAIGLVVLAVLAVVYAVFVFAVGNPRVVAQLREAPQGARARKVMLLTLPTGGHVPVNYLREGDTVYAGADGRWWRALRGDGAPVTLLIRGETLHGHATAIESDPARTRDVFARLRPNVPAWLPGWLDAVLVAIELDRSAAETR